MSIRTSDIPFTASAAGPNDTIIALVEISPGTFRLRRVPKSDVGIPGPTGSSGTNGTDGIQGPNGTNGTNGTNGINGTDGTNAAFQLGFAASDETTDLTTGDAKITLRAPSAFTLTGVRANINTVSSSGVITVDINKNGVTVLSTKITIDVGEETSVTAATPPVISVSAFASDDEITVDIDGAGTGAKGLKIWLLGTF